jgi:integrase
MEAASGLGGIRGLSFHYLAGLLACTGLRIGEALRLREEDMDWTAGLMTIRHSKRGRSRCLPLHASTLEALDAYRRKRRRHLREGKPTPLFIQNGRAITYPQAADTFAYLRRILGWNQSPVPRWHDLRHTFAVNCLLNWYRKGDEVAPKVLSLATYLGHSNIRGTYWYLSAVPELLAMAHARWPQLNTNPGGSHA